MRVCVTDVIAQAKSGTGKTLVFAIAALELIDLSRRSPQVTVPFYASVSYSVRA